MRILPFGYAYSNDEIVWTRSKKALISHTSLRTHPLQKPQNQGRVASLLYSYNIVKKWCKFYFKAFFTTTKPLKIALLYRTVGDCYGHFIQELIGGYFQLKCANITPDKYILPTNYPFQIQMYELLGIPKEAIIPSSPNTLIHAKELIVPTLIADYEMVEYRKYLCACTFVQPLFLASMYEYLLPNLMRKAPQNRKIFLVRPSKGNRDITNLAEVQDIFKQYGYEMILPDSMSLESQIALFREAKVVASVHGSGLNNVAFCQENTIILEIFPQYFHYRNPQLIAITRGCRYYYMVGETKDVSMHPQYEHVYVHPSALHKALSLLAQLM